MYRPSEAGEMTTPLILQVPTASRYNGVNYKSAYTDSNDVIFANFKTFGGTEKVVDGVLEVEETAQITTWFRPDIKSGCRLKRAEDGALFEILGDPEDIEMRHQYLRFKIRRLKGGA